MADTVGCIFLFRTVAEPSTRRLLLSHQLSVSSKISTFPFMEFLSVAVEGSGNQLLSKESETDGSEM